MTFDQRSTIAGSYDTITAGCCVSFLEKCYPRIERIFRVCHTVGWVGAQSLGLGLMDPEELVRLTVQRFELSSYRDRTYNTASGLWLWEREALRRFFPPAGSIAIGAAGKSAARPRVPK